MAAVESTTSARSRRGSEPSGCIMPAARATAISVPVLSNTTMKKNVSTTAAMADVEQGAQVHLEEHRRDRRRQRGDAAERRQAQHQRGGIGGEDADQDGAVAPCARRAPP